MAEVALQTRAAIVPAIVAGVIALIVGFSSASRSQASAFCIGLGLGMFNARVLQTSVARRFESSRTSRGRHALPVSRRDPPGLSRWSRWPSSLVRPLGFGMILGMVVPSPPDGFAAAAMLKTVRP